MRGGITDGPSLVNHHITDPRRPRRPKQERGASESSRGSNASISREGRGPKERQGSKGAFGGGCAWRINELKRTA